MNHTRQPTQLPLSDDTGGAWADAGSLARHLADADGLLGPAAGAASSAVPGGAGGGAAGGTAAEGADHWTRFLQQLGPSGQADLPARMAQVLQRVREDGATYNVYAEGDAGARPWPLQLLPMIVGHADWALIERGVLQRARLMAATLADLYGSQQLLAEALLPTSLVFAHPQFLRPMVGLRPPGGQHLHVAAFDLARSAAGGWHVLGQRLQAPSGLGYLLENRLIIRPQFSDAFGALRVQGVAGSFRTLMEGLVRSSPAGPRSRVVLLSPGPLNETYFEQVFLARYLGIALVEGSDLTVRGHRLYLKTLNGLDQVHVVLRRVDDEWLDPLELRADSALGVPGLLQAMRAGQVVVANAPGTGVLESPGLAAFWPGVAERLLDEPLRLPASTSWWCGEGTVWQAQRTRLADFVAVPTFPGAGEGRVVAHLPPAEQAALLARIDADPAAWTLQARVQPSTTPVWTPDGVQARHAVLRVYALSDGQGGWRVLPGAMTRVADSPHERDPWLSMQRGAQSVDTWVVAGDVIDRSTLLPQPLAAEELQGWHRSVTSRAAENLFWLGRYTERAENAVRLVRLMLEGLPDASQPVLRWFDALARIHGLVPAEVPGAQRSPRVFARALVQALSAGPEGDEGATSVSFSLRCLRQCAQALRERLSPEHWKLIHEVGDHFDQHLAQVLAQGEGHDPSGEVLGLLARAGTHLAAITGAQTDRMTRDDGWRLLSVGRQIERLEMLSQGLQLGFEHGLFDPERADDGFNLLLGLFDSLITYRAQFQARREVLPLLHLVVLDTDNPRSLAWVARTMRDRLRKLARHDPLWVAQVTDGLPEPETWQLAELARRGADGRHAVLEAALGGCTEAARQLSDAIGRHLFAHVLSPDRTVWQ